MTTRAPFLSQRYGAYYHRDIPEEDAELIHVGPGTPCGEWWRRFWIPVAVAEELRDLPMRIRILGEDLVVFKDRRGAVGLLELHCPHRGTSLEFGLVADRGIRCCYHGWLMDVDGRILETPGEPSDSTLRDRLCHGAYPTQEYNGLVFAYMGPPDKQPPLPIYDTFDQEGFTAVPHIRRYLHCNWLQVKENSMDPTHVRFLHGLYGLRLGGPEIDLPDETDFLETPLGMQYIDTRRVGPYAWVRISDYIIPAIHQFPTVRAPNPEKDNEEVEFIRPPRIDYAVPVDDTCTMFMGYKFLAPGQPSPKTIDEDAGLGQTDERSYEERQRFAGDYDAQVSIHRGMSRHGLEHLASSDRGIIMMRRLIRQGIQAVQRGEDPKGVLRNAADLVPTYASATVVRVPEASTWEADRELLADTGRRVAEGYLSNPPTLASSRHRGNGTR